MGAGAYDIIMDYSEILDGKVALEIGASCNGFGGDFSTTFFAAITKYHKNLTFYSIDKNQNLVNFHSKYQDLIPGRFHVLCGDGDKMLDQVHGEIAFAYLDNYDYIPPGSEDNDVIAQLILSYKRDWNLALTNMNSAKAHLAQTKKIVAKSADRCVILFDDTWQISQGKFFKPAQCKHIPRPWLTDALQTAEIPDTAYHKDWYGKGATAVPWLLSQGWTLIQKDQHHVPRDDWTALKNW